VLTVLVGVLVAVQIYQGGRRYVGPRCRIIVDPDTYPVSAVRFLKMNRIQGNLLLPFDWGEYAIWKLYPACKVSIDGRFRTVYPEAVIKDHFISRHDAARWRTLIEKYPADLLLVRQIPFFQTLIKEDGPWVYVYSDAMAIVFLRDCEENGEALERFRAGKFERPTAAPPPYFP
jgi:hypothetical protein